MPWIGGRFQSDNRSPMERLFGFEKVQAERESLKRQQDIMRERQKILAESLTPSQAGDMSVAFQQAQQQPQSFEAMFSQAMTGGAPASIINAQAPEEVNLQMTEAKPAQFDSEAAINRLYGIGDFEGARSIVDNEYKDAMASRTGAGGERFFGNGEVVRGPDGRLYKQLTSNAGNTKLVPIEGEMVGGIKTVDRGNAVEVLDREGNTVRVLNVAPTPYQSFQMDPTRQAEVAGAEAAAKTTAEVKAKEEAGLESAASTYDKTLGIIDELIRHPGRGFATGKSAVLNIAPGTEGADFVEKLEQLAGQNFLTEIQRMKGLGALSENEGKKLAAAAAALSTRRTDEGFLAELTKLRDELQFFKARAERKKSEAANRRNPQQATKPNTPAAPQKGTIKNGYVFMGGNPADPKAWRKL